MRTKIYDKMFKDLNCLYHKTNVFAGKFFKNFVQSEYLPFSHLESCCSVLIGCCDPNVRKMAKSRPMKSADVPEYSSPSDK